MTSMNSSGVLSSLKRTSALKISEEKELKKSTKNYWHINKSHEEKTAKSEICSLFWHWQSEGYCIREGWAEQASLSSGWVELWSCRRGRHLSWATERQMTHLFCMTVCVLISIHDKLAWMFWKSYKWPHLANNRLSSNVGVAVALVFAACTALLALVGPCWQLFRCCKTAHVKFHVEPLWLAVGLSKSVLEKRHGKSSAVSKSFCEGLHSAIVTVIAM